MSRTKAEIAGAIALAAAIAFVAAQYVSARDALRQAEATEKTEQAQIAALQKQRDALSAADRARDQAAQQKIAALEKSAAIAKTPQQIAKWLPAQIPLPRPIRISIPPATPASLAAGIAPEAIAQIPEEDLAPLRDLTVKAQSCAIALPAAQQDLSSCRAQLKLAGEQLAAAEAERDAYKKAAKGTFWRRTIHALKIFGVGAAAGAAAVCGSGHCK